MNRVVFIFLSILLIVFPLTIENLENALKINPWCLDFNSGVESAPGLKDHSKIMEILSYIKK